MFSDLHFTPFLTHRSNHDELKGIVAAATTDTIAATTTTTNDSATVSATELHSRRQTPRYDTVQSLSLLLGLPVHGGSFSFIEIQARGPCDANRDQTSIEGTTTPPTPSSMMHPAAGSKRGEAMREGVPICAIGFFLPVNEKIPCHE